MLHSQQYFLVRLTEMIPLLLSNGAKIDKQNSAKETALIYAIKNTKIEATKILLENGANIEQIDHKRRSAMSYAKELGDTEMLGLLGLEKKFSIRIN